MPKKLFLIAGEASGDLHGAHLVSELKKVIPDLECRGLGGSQMKEAGVELLHDLTKEAALGLGDVLRKYFHYRKIFHEALSEVDTYKPDAIVLIDYPGFNLRFAKKINKRIPIIYYVSPQIWAWGARRIQTIRDTVHHMMVFFKFEADMYRRARVPVTWVGHPLVGHVQSNKPRHELRSEWLGVQADGTKIVGLFPGSRESEVRRILPEMLAAAREIHVKQGAVQFLLCESNTLSPDLYTKILNHSKFDIDLKRLRNRVYDIFFGSDFAMVSSGTATLEAALASVPFVILYKTAWSTFLLGRWLVRIPYIGLVNVVAGRKIVPEFIQSEIHTETIAHEAGYLLDHRELREKMILQLKEVQGKLGEAGAAARAAATVASILEPANKAEALV